MPEIVLTEENFEREVLDSPIPVMVDFFATWCGPCRMLGPVIAEIAEEASDRVKVCRVDVDEQPALAQLYAIEAVPTVILFRDGKPAQTVLGLRTKEQLLALL